MTDSLNEPEYAAGYYLYPGADYLKEITSRDAERYNLHKCRGFDDCWTYIKEGKWCEVCVCELEPDVCKHYDYLLDEHSTCKMGNPDFCIEDNECWNPDDYERGEG
jgi:hypothetical protein